MKKVLSLILVAAMMLTVFTVSFNASFSVSDKDEDGKTLIWSAKDAIADYEKEQGIEVETKRIYFQMPDGNRGAIAQADHSVTITDYTPQIDPETGEVVVDPETGEPVMVPSGTHDEVVIHAGEKAPTWYNEYNVLDGQTYAACYWWGGTCDPEHNYSVGWCGYRAEIEDYDQGIYYIDLPDDVSTIIWNNGVDGGMDSTQPKYYMAAQISDLNSEGALEGEFDTLPYGSPDPDYFDRCIYIIDPDKVDVNPLTNKQTCIGNWYVYYGDGCYGSEFKDGVDYDATPGWSEDMQDVCLNPDHYDANGRHVGAQGGGDHVHTPAAAVHENEILPTYKSTGSYDEVVYCSECGAEISRTKKTSDKIQLESNKLYFDAASTGWSMGASDKIAFHIFGGDLTNGLDWGKKKSVGTATAGTSGLFEIDPSKPTGQNYTLTPGVQYKIIFSRVSSNSWREQTYDLLFTTDCLGHVAYCDGTEYENPVDSTKSTLAAFWYQMDAAQIGPVLQISSIGNVVGTCPESGRTPESIFNDFVTVPVTDFGGKTGLENADYYTVQQAKTKTAQQMIDDIGSDLGLTKQQVYDAFTNNGVEYAWDYTVSTLPGSVVQPTEAPTEGSTTVHVHTPGDPVRENIVKSTCTAKGSYDYVVYCTECGAELSRTKKTVPMKAHTPGDPVHENEVPATCEHGASYDEVIYCTVCGNEISRETVTTGEAGAHNIKFKPGKKATETTDGWKSYFYCTNCGKFFGDQAGTIEVTWDQIVIPATSTPTQAPTQKPTEPPVVTGILGDIDNDGDVTIIDATIMQRVDAGIKTCTSEMLVRGDVDKDKSVSVLDATYVRRYLLVLDDGFGIGQPLS